MTVGGLLNGTVRLDSKPSLPQEKVEALARAAVARPQASLLAETKLMVFDQSLFADVKPKPYLA